MGIDVVGGVLDRINNIAHRKDSVMNSHGRVNCCGMGISTFAAGWTALGALALPLSIAQTAHGDIVTVQVSGTVTKVEHTAPSRLDFDGSVVIGSPYHLTFVIDTDAVDSDPDPGRGAYLIESASGEIGNYTWSKTQAPVFGIEVYNDQHGVADEYELGSQDFEFNENFLIDGIPTLLSKNAFEFVSARILLTDLSTSALDSDALVLPVLDGWGLTSFGFQFVSDENAVGFHATVYAGGTIDSITIPEPGAAIIAGLLLAGYTGLGRCR